MKVKGIYPKGDKFQVKKTFPGRPQVTGMFPTLKAAEAFIHECAAAYASGKPFPEARTSGSTYAASVKTLQGLYEDALMAKWSGNSDNASAEAARVFVAWAGPASDPAKKLTMESLLEFIQERKKLGNSGSTINRKLTGFKALMEVAFDLKLIPGLLRIPRQKEGDARERFYSMDEQRAIIDMTRKLGDNHYADLWQVLVDTGARPKEMQQVKWTDLRSGQVTLSSVKGGKKKTRSVELTPAAMEAIQRRRDCPKYGHLMGPFTWATKVRITDKWRTLRRFISWLDEETVPYTFRHTCASRLAMAGHSAPMIMNWMGHTTIMTTQRYMHLSPASVQGLVNSLANFTDPTFERRAA
jgi:integrase